MISLLNNANGLTGGQIAIIVIISVLFVIAAALNIYLFCLLKKRNAQRRESHVRQMETEELQAKYDKLVGRLKALKNGTPVAELEPLDYDESALLSKFNALRGKGSSSNSGKGKKK